MIHCDDLLIGYGDKAVVKNLSFDIVSGSFTVITGCSGRGKSTLLKTLMGVLNPISGTITTDYKSMEEYWRNTTYIPQDINFPVKTVEEMVRMPFELKNNRKQCDVATRLDRFFHIIEDLGLDRGIYRKELNEISGGEKQRVLIAIAIALDKKIIFADEPTSALDEDSISRLVKIVKQETERGTTIVASSHNSMFIKEADRLINL